MTGALSVPIGSTDSKSYSNSYCLICATICLWCTNSPDPSPPFIYLNHILGAFVELQKATVDFVMSLICPSAGNTLAPTGQILCNFMVEAFTKIC